MKPHLYLRHGIWNCHTRYHAAQWRRFPLGCGYTPAEAYADWKAQL